MYCLNFGPQGIGKLYSDVRDSAGHGGIGNCLLACGYDSGQLNRAELPNGDEDYFDPQLYLAGLDASSGDNRVKRLSTHSWFLPKGVEEFDSSEVKKREWLKDIESRLEQIWPGSAPKNATDIDRSIEYAIRVQKAIGVTRVILPAPLLEAREDGAGICGTWARRGAAKAKELGISEESLATIAIREDLLNDSAFDQLGFVDQIVSEVASCRGIAGVYVVIAQTGSPAHPFVSQPRVCRGYGALIAKAASVKHLRTRIVNFADIAGMGCIGMGATHVFGGCTQSTRRLALEASDGGRAYPLYFTTLAMAELRPEDDLSRVVQENLLSRVEDASPFCEGLMAALRAGGTAGSVAAWAQDINNVQESQRHLVWKSAETTNRLISMGLAPARAEFKRMIDDAMENQVKIWAIIEEQATRYRVDLSAMRNGLGY